MTNEERELCCTTIEYGPYKGNRWNTLPGGYIKDQYSRLEVGTIEWKICKILIDNRKPKSVGCPFPWSEGGLTVDRWNGKHTGGPGSDFRESKGRLVRVKGVNESLMNQRIRFGKFKGKKWSQVDRSYLEWIVRTFDRKDKSKRMAKEVLEQLS